MQRPRWGRSRQVGPWPGLARLGPARRAPPGSEPPPQPPTTRAAIALPAGWSSWPSHCPGRLIKSPSRRSPSSPANKQFRARAKPRPGSARISSFCLETVTEPTQLAGGARAEADSPCSSHTGPRKVAAFLRRRPPSAALGRAGPCCLRGWGKRRRAGQTRWDERSGVRPALGSGQKRRDRAGAGGAGGRGRGAGAGHHERCCWKSLASRFDPASRG